MNIKQLENEIENMGIDPENINIGVRGRYDACFNLVHKKNGKWEIFYGEQGKKFDAQLFSTQEEACDALVKLLRQRLNDKELEDKPKYWHGYRRYAERYQINTITGIFIFSMLCGIAGAGYQIYLGEINYMFWIWIGWIVVFGICTYCSRGERANELFEYIGQILVQLFCLLIGVAIMIVMPIVNIPQYISGETDLFSLIATICLEPVMAVWVYWNYRVIRDDYGDDFKEYFEEKKTKAKERREAKAANRSKDNP